MLQALRAGVRFAEAERTFVVQIGPFRGWLDVEDTAFFVDAYDAETGEVDVSDRTREPLDAASLVADADDALRCTVKRRFAARFTRTAQAELLAALELEDGRVVVRAGDERRVAPRLRV
jgi:hypothetical protein